MNKLASLWIGDSFSPLERMCASSFIAQGNSLTIFTYGDISNVPKGVEVRDAEEIMSGSHIVRHRRSGSPAIHSDLFRYALISKTDFVWIDLDIVALKPFDFETAHIFGRENSYLINSAVLGLPKNSPTLIELCKIDANTRGYPPAVKRSKYLKMAVISLGRGRFISDWPWATTGPVALTHYLRKYGEDIHALPQETFYHVPWQESRKFLSPDGVDESNLPNGCCAVHLWNSHIKKILEEEYSWKIPKNSFIGRMMVKYEIECYLV